MAEKLSIFALATLHSIFLFPLDTIKTRIQARHIKEDNCGYLKNHCSKVSTLKGLQWGIFYSLIIEGFRQADKKL